VKELIDGTEVIHNKKAVRFEVDAKAEVKEMVEIYWQNGEQHKVERS
jgi:hypothetical protein